MSKSLDVIKKEEQIYSEVFKQLDKLKSDGAYTHLRCSLAEMVARFKSERVNAYLIDVGVLEDDEFEFLIEGLRYLEIYKLVFRVDDKFSIKLLYKFFQNGYNNLSAVTYKKIWFNDSYKSFDGFALSLL